MKSTFKVLFYLKKGSEKKNGEVMIMARITIDGKLCQFSTKQGIQPDNWNTAAGKAKGRDAGRINALLDDIRSSNALISSGEWYWVFSSQTSFFVFSIS